MNPRKFFGRRDDDDDDDTPGDDEAPRREFDFSALDEVMDAGLRPGSSKSKFTSGAEWRPQGGTINQIEDEDLEKEIEALMADFEVDPVAATRKQLVRMVTIEWRYLQSLYKELSKEDGQGRRGLRAEINASSENLLTIQKALKALPSQRKDDVDQKNVASLAQMFEDKIREMGDEDPNDFKDLLKAQRERILRDEQGGE